MKGWSDMDIDTDPFDPFPATLRLTRVTPISNEEIDRSYNRSLAQQQREISALCASVAHLETRLEEAHRTLARQAATIARLRRRGPRWWEWALAGLVCALEAFGRWSHRWYTFENDRRGK